MKNLETENYLIRAPKIEDAEEIFKKWGKFNDETEYKNYKEHSSLIETKAIIKASISDTNLDLPFWHVETKDTKEIIGYIKMLTESEKDKKCEISFEFLEEWREIFIVKEILEKIIDYLFTEKVYEIIIVTFYDRSQESTEKLDQILSSVGMIKEARLRNRMINSKGEKIDKIIYSILKEDY